MTRSPPRSSDVELSGTETRTPSWKRCRRNGSAAWPIRPADSSCREEREKGKGERGRGGAILWGEQEDKAIFRYLGPGG